MLRRVSGITAMGLIALLGVGPAGAQNAAAPDLSGAWSRLTFGFEPPPTGQGPIANGLAIRRIPGARAPLPIATLSA